MRNAIQIIVIIILLAILLKKPTYLIDFGKTNEGMIVFLVLMILSSFLSTSIAILVGAVIIVIIKEGCNCQPTEIIIKNKQTKAKQKKKESSIIYSSNILDSHKNTIYYGQDTNVYPNPDNDNWKDISLSNDILHNSECMKPSCCRNYAK